MVTADFPSCDLYSKEEHIAGWTYSAAREPRKFIPYMAEPTKRQTFELGYANLLLQEMTAKAIARFRYSWENVAVRLVVRQRLAAQGFMPSKPRAA